MTALADPRPTPKPRPDPHPVDPRRPRGAADPAAQSYLSELRAVVADAWRGTSVHATTAALRATRAGRLALGAVHLGRRLVCADLTLMSRAERDELVAEARRRDLFRRWP